jgi:hypothetical protein
MERLKESHEHQDNNGKDNHNVVSLQRADLNISVRGKSGMSANGSAG